MFERRRAEIADTTQTALAALLSHRPQAGEPARPPRLVARFTEYDRALAPFGARAAMLAAAARFAAERQA